MPLKTKAAGLVLSACGDLACFIIFDNDINPSVVKRLKDRFIEQIKAYINCAENGMYNVLPNVWLPCR